MSSTVMLRVVQLLGQPAPRDIAARFEAPGGTIGRAPENTLSLPDPLRQISRIHARLDCAGEGWTIICVGQALPISVNGHGLTNQQAWPLRDGDRITIGGFELQASVVTATQTPARGTGDPALPDGAAEQRRSVPATHEREIAADSLDALFGLDQARDPLAADSPLPRVALGGALADVGAGASPDPAAAAPGTVVSWQIPQPASAPTATPKRSLTPTPTPAPTPTPTPLAAPVRSAATARSKASPAVIPGRTPSKPALEAVEGAAAASEVDLLMHFLRGAGLDELPRNGVDPGAPAPGLSPALMERIGELLRVSLEGTLRLMQARATIKREMRTELTTIGTRHNNPIKFSPDAAAALANLLQAQPVRGFLEPVPALRDAFDDLLAHQVGFVAGMRAAVAGIVGRFDPAALAQEVPHRPLIDALLPAARDARLWALFGQRFAALSREAEDDFETFFGREFVRAYEAQVHLLHDRDPSTEE